MLNLSLLGAAAGPAASVVFSFAPHFTNINANDPALEAYGFAPVGGRFLPMYGVRGRFVYGNGLIVGMVASSGFGSTEATGNPVPTTTSWTKIGSTIGWAPSPPLEVSADLGFGALTHSVGSAVQGGALLYLGPFIHPHVAVTLLPTPTHLSLSAGWMLQVPLSAPHQQPLWEEPFERALVHGPSVAVNIGMGR